MSAYDSCPTLTLKKEEGVGGIVPKIIKQLVKMKTKKREKEMQLYLGRVTITGSAATAGMLQLMSGFISKRISLLISTLCSRTDNNFFCSW